MTEADWLTSTELQWVRSPLLANRSTRKWRCFALACIRLIWHLLAPTRRHAVEVSERFLEGQASNRERSEARGKVRVLPPDEEAMIPYPDGIGASIGEAVYWATAAPTDIISAASGMPHYVGRVVSWERGPAAVASLDDTCIAFLRDIFGNPFRQVPFERTWRTADVLNLARTAYEERLPDGKLDAVGLAVLADALEEAGCTQPDIVGHLRGGGPHVPGCWVLDRLLGKK